MNNNRTEELYDYNINNFSAISFIRIGQSLFPDINYENNKDFFTNELRKQILETNFGN